QHPHRLTLGAEPGDHPVGERGLPRSGRAGDAQHVGPAGPGEERLEARSGRGILVVDAAHEPAGGANLAGEHPVHERGRAHGSSPPSQEISPGAMPTARAATSATPGKSSSWKCSAHFFPSGPARSPRKVRPRTRAATKRYRSPRTVKSETSSSVLVGGTRAAGPNRSASSP